ncbi:MAG: hypothetical protein QW039_05755 [Fervidicoccaceae archaeon]
MAKCSRARLIENKFVCEDSQERIEFLDGLYRTKKGSMKVSDEEGKELDWLEIMRIRSKSDANSWIIFSVYYDLRERGRSVREGPFPNTLELVSEGKPFALVFVVEETIKFKVKVLSDWLDLSRRFGREVIIAIVDKHGDVSYYTMERFS